ncbi:MAG: hypothetical protein MJZ15_02760 [Bacteroidales bacterium]|nr:hypothetical protein [Bacteroidales bacterium]
MALATGTSALWADEKPAIVVNQNTSPQYVKLTTDAKITISTEGGVAKFVVDESAEKADIAEGETISFGVYDFDDAATAIEEMSAGKEIVGTEYYTLQGVKLEEPQKGVIIIKVIYSDGTSKSLKTIKK